MVTMTATQTIVREHEADLVVQLAETVADGVVALTLADPTGEPLPPWTPGAHIHLLLGDDLSRQYSLCSSPSKPDSWRWAPESEHIQRERGAFVAPGLWVDSWDVDVDHGVDAPRVLTFRFTHAVTPVSAGRTRHAWRVSRNFALGEQASNVLLPIFTGYYRRVQSILETHAGSPRRRRAQARGERQRRRSRTAGAQDNPQHGHRRDRHPGTATEPNSRRSRYITGGLTKLSITPPESNSSNAIDCVHVCQVGRDEAE